MALDSLGNLYIADTGNNRVRQASTNGVITTVAGNGTGGYFGDGGAAANATFDDPFGVAFDSLGNLYIATDNNVIREVSTNGVITTVAGNGTNGYSGDGGAATNAELSQPSDVITDSLGNLYISLPGNNVIRKVEFVSQPILTLPNVTLADSGSYTVIVSNPYGSVTSVVATLTFNIPRTPPQIITNDASFGLLTNRFGFNVSGVNGQTIVVDGSTNLVDWTPLLTNTIGSGPFYFFDPAWANYPWRFYRARLP